MVSLCSPGWPSNLQRSTCLCFWSAGIKGTWYYLTSLHFDYFFYLCRTLSHHVLSIWKTLLIHYTLSKSYICQYYHKIYQIITKFKNLILLLGVKFRASCIYVHQASSLPLSDTLRHLAKTSKSWKSVTQWWVFQKSNICLKFCVFSLPSNFFRKAWFLVLFWKKLSS